jgi:hypothetical protein
MEPHERGRMAKQPSTHPFQVMEEKRSTPFWNGRSGWYCVRRNSRPTWPQIDRKRTREQLRALVRVINRTRSNKVYG